MASTDSDCCCAIFTELWRGLLLGTATNSIKLPGMNDNPYAAPWVARLEARLVDRAQRDELAAAIRRYLAGEISAFAFDELLWEFGAATDATVKEVAHAMWFHYDDCTDHYVRASKPEWNYFQRLLLLLASDRHLQTSVARRWSWSQLVAAAALAGFVAAAFWIGWGQQLLAVSIPFGAISIAISWWRCRRPEHRGAYELILTPFATFGELKSTYESVATFKKDRYPASIDRQLQMPIHSPMERFGASLNMYSAWLMFAPLPLLAQMFPASHRTSRVA